MQLKYPILAFIKFSIFKHIKHLLNASEINLHICNYGERLIIERHGYHYQYNEIDK